MNTDRNRETFDKATLLQKAVSMLGWSGKPEEIAQKVRQLERGLPAEDQFAALCVWMGRCSLIHKLEQEQFPNLSREKYQVPDFLAVFNHSDREIPALIEVKKTTNPKLRPFGSKLYGKLNNYANLVRLPLLVAWYSERLNLWCLFDIQRMQRKRTAFHMDLNAAINNSLLGVLFDDVIFKLRPGVKLQFRVRKEPGSEKRDPDTGKLRKFTGFVEGSAWLNPDDNRMATDPSLGKLLELLLLVVDNDAADTEDENYVTLAFYTTEETSLFAHQLLGVMAFGTAILSEGAPNWLQVMKANTFQMDYPSVRNALSIGVKEGAVRVILQQNPVVRPEFL